MATGAVVLELDLDLDLEGAIALHHMAQEEGRQGSTFGYKRTDLKKILVSLMVLYYNDNKIGGNINVKRPLGGIVLFTYLASDRPIQASATSHVDGFDLFFRKADGKLCNDERKAVLHFVAKRTEDHIRRDEGQDTSLSAIFSSKGSDRLEGEGRRSALVVAAVCGKEEISALFKDTEA